MDIITIVIVDDHEIFRKGLRTIINEITEIKVIDEASNGHELLDILKKQEIDIVFMDIKMPVMDGVESTRKVKEKFPKTKVVALTMHEEIGYFNRMMEAGADGFLLKNTTRDELETAINQVIKGEGYFSPEFAESAKKFMKDKQKEPPVKLSEREQQVLELICKGYNNTEISKHLGLSARTIDGHRAKLFDKTGAKNAPNLVMYAIKHGLVKA